MPIPRSQVPSFQVESLRVAAMAPGHARPSEPCIAQAEKIASVLWAYAEVLVDVTPDGRIVLETTQRAGAGLGHASWVVGPDGRVSLPSWPGEVLFFLATHTGPLPW